MLTEEQAEKIKLHLLEQIEKFPEDQRKIVKHKILSMNAKELEEFLKENGLDYSNEEKPQQCIFCMINEGKIKSYKVSEDKNYNVFLEINPISKGHMLVVPKHHFSVDKLSEDSLEFAKKIAEKISKKFSPKEIKFAKNEITGHAVLELIPIYGDEKERKKATEEELGQLQEVLSEEKKLEKKEEELPSLDLKDFQEVKPVAEVKKLEHKPELPKIKLRIP